MAAKTICVTYPKMEIYANYVKTTKTISFVSPKDESDIGQLQKKKKKKMGKMFVASAPLMHLSVNVVHILVILLVNVNYFDIKQKMQHADCKFISLL